MQSLSRVIIGSVRRVCSAPPSWWLRAPAGRHTPLLASASALGNQYFDRLFRIGVRSEKRQSKLDGRLDFSCVESMNKFEAKKAAEESKPSNPMVEMLRVTKDIQNNPFMPAEDIWDLPIKSESSHRDGTIYKTRLAWQNSYYVDVADRTKTHLEPVDGDRLTCEMMQIFSLKLSKTPMNSGSVQLYGYIAARDEVDRMLNYVFNRSRDNPIIVQQGSLIQMTGPKRGISLFYNVLLEFDMRIKNGEKEEDDLQLIDGMSEFDGLCMPATPYKVRIGGNCGAVDMCLSLVQNAVGAIVEVEISELQSAFDLSISSIVSVMEVHEEFQLFHGTINESCSLRRFVIAVDVDTVMHLKFKVGQKGSNSNMERNSSFKAKLYGYTNRRIKLELASISVKVTWATWPE